VCFRFLSHEKNGNNHNSSTPILDLLEPLPKPEDEIVTGKFALPFLAPISLVVIAENFSFLWVVFEFLLILVLTVAVHEFGHLLAGRCAGLRFHGAKIGPLSVKCIRQKWSVRFLPRLYRGEVHMGLDRIRRIRSRLALGVLGGPAASYLCGIGAFVAGEILRSTSDSMWPTFLGFFGFFSFCTGMLSSIPFRGGYYGNDAYILRQLLYSKEESKFIMTTYALGYIGLVKPARPVYQARWWQVVGANANPRSQKYYSDWNAYRDAQDPQIAAECLERLLHNSSYMEEESRQHLVAEAAYFVGWQRRNAANAKQWLRQLKHPDWLTPLQQLRVGIAVDCAQDRYDEALTKCDTAIRMLDSPDFEKDRAEWITRKQTIEDTKNPGRLWPAND
jgi:hypothetical protein